MLRSSFRVEVGGGGDEFFRGGFNFAKEAGLIGIGWIGEVEFVGGDKLAFLMEGSSAGEGLVLILDLTEEAGTRFGVRVRVKAFSELRSGTVVIV